MNISSITHKFESTIKVCPISNEKRGAWEKHLKILSGILERESTDKGVRTLAEMKMIRTILGKF